MSRKVGMISLGCPKNQIDAEIMLKKLTDADYILVQEADKADVVIVNTCGFIEDSKKESIDAILEMVDYKDDNFEGSMRGWMKTECSTAQFLEQLSINGATHHSVFVYDANIEELKYFGSLLGIETVEQM